MKMLSCSGVEALRSPSFLRYRQLGGDTAKPCARATLLLLTVVAVAACAIQTTLPGVVGVDRTQRMFISTELINTYAAGEYRSLISSAASEGYLDTDREELARVDRVLTRLVAQTVAFRPDALRWQWEAHVISSNERNAWCLPGGKIVIYTGLSRGLDLTDAELAAIMGHEMAHALREHGRESLSRQLATNLGLGILVEIADFDAEEEEITRLLTQVLFTLPNSREEEAEADLIGMELAARAGFQPSAAISVWRKMAAAGDGGTPEFLSTHPASSSRIRDLERILPRVMPLYTGTDSGAGGNQGRRTTPTLAEVQVTAAGAGVTERSRASTSTAAPRDGPFEMHYTSGQLREKRTYKDGKLDGPYEKYYRNGQLWEKGTYTMGRRCSEWLEDGEPVTHPPCPPGLEDGN